MCLESCGLSRLNRCSCDGIKMIIGAFLTMATGGECIPNCIRPFVSGMFLPMLFVFMINYNYLFPTDTSLTFLSVNASSLLVGLYSTAVTLFVLTALRGGGSLNTEEMKERTEKLLAEKAYLRNSRMYCSECEVVAGFRSNHCPMCKECVSKHSKHSMVLNSCIGSNN